MVSHPYQLLNHFCDLSDQEIVMVSSYPVLADIIEARNVVNTEAIEDFVKGFHVEDLPEVNKWLDSTFRKFLINKYEETKKYSPKPSDPEWMQGKSDLEEVLLDTAIQAKVEHLVDFLKNKLTETPDFKLGAFQAEEALKQSQEWFERLKKKKAGAEEENVDYKIVKPLSDGWNWVEVISQNGLIREGNKMGHCVGGYWERVKKKLDQIYSLRDAKNEPHATIEYSKGTVQQIKGKQNKGVIADYMPYVVEFLSKPPIPIRKVSEHDLNLNGLLKSQSGYISMRNIPEGTVVEQDLDLKKLDNVVLPKNLTVNGNLLVNADEDLPENLTVKGELKVTGSGITSLPSGLNVGSLNIFKSRITELPADIKIKVSLNAEFSHLEKIPALKLTGDLTISDTEISVLPPGLKVGGELDIMNTPIRSIPKNTKVGVAIFVDDPEEMEIPENLKELVH